MPLPTVRVLPVTIVAGSLLLALQAGSLWTTAALLFAGPAHAEETKDADKATAAAAGEKKPAGDKAGKGVAADEDEEKDPLADFTPEEIEVLYDLAQRRETLDQREAALAAREALIDAAEKRMQARVDELQQLRGSIETLVRQYSDQERKELESVVKIYETMKPKDAAAILEKLEMPVLLSIIDAMKERRTSAILAGMTPDRARQVTAEMARKKEIDLTRIGKDGNPG